MNDVACERMHTHVLGGENMRRLWSHIVIAATSLLMVGATFATVVTSINSNIEFEKGRELVFRVSNKDADGNVDKDYVFNAWSNTYAMVASTFILSIIGTIIIETILKPKVKESIKEEDELAISRKGLLWSSIAFVILMLIGIYTIVPDLPGSGLLLDNTKTSYVTQLLGEKAPFQDAFGFIFLIIMMVCSGIYGKISKNIKSTNDFSVGLSKEFDNLGYIFILMFFSALMISVLNWTNLGTVIGSWLISFMSNLEFTGLPLIVTMFIIIIIMSFVIPDTVTKWQIASPILIPLFMKANITPDFTQFIFKAADSVGKGMTPFFIYFIIMLAFLEKYNNKETNKITVFGTLNLLRPTILIFMAVWLLIVVGWFIMGLPLGPNTAPTL